MSIFIIIICCHIISISIITIIVTIIISFLLISILYKIDLILIYFEYLIALMCKLIT